MLADLGLQMCAPGEGCPTPWDACCQTPETITTNAITVQVKDDTGQVARTGLESLPSLKPLATITVRGKISEQNGQALVFDTESIYIHP